MQTHLRIARPVTDLALSRSMYCDGLGMRVIGSFEDHDGFDGVMLGRMGMSYHIELTYCRSHPVQPSPTPEDLIVFYVPNDDDWRMACDRILAAGFVEVEPYNPYWALRGRSFADRDGYLIVLQNAFWDNGVED